MSKKSLLITLLLFVFLLAPTASAQLGSTGSARLESVKERLMERKQSREDLQELIQEKKEELRLQVQNRREEFKENLQAIKDQRKQELAERIDGRLTIINQKGISRLTSAVNKLEELLDKFSQRVATAKTEGKDTTNADSAILAAEDAIADAKEAVADQAGKEYVAEIPDEEALKNAVGDVVSSLRQDLKNTFETVKNAKQKVMDVAREVAKLRSSSNTASPSADTESVDTIEN